MKKILLIVTIFCVFTLTTKAQVSECAKKMREGKFTYEGREYDVQVIRTKNKQVEIFNNGKSKIISKIHWVSDTEYWLIFKRSKNVKMVNRKKGEIMKVKIISCEGNKYYYECRGDKVSYTDGNMIKLD